MSRRRAIIDWLAKGPFAIAAAALRGGMNYFIVLYLAYAANLTATGEYRTLFSYYTLLGLVSLVESNKTFIKAVLAEDRAAGTAIFATRVVFGTGAFLAVALIWGAGRLLGQQWLPDILVVIAAISAVIYPFDLYISNLQARRRFQRLLIVDLAKYGMALGAFIAMVAGGIGVATATLVQLGVIGVFNIVLFWAHSREWVVFRDMPGHWRRMLRSEASYQTRMYSFANMLPASLENVDKLLVGQVFGLEFLGVYTLAYSTGRFLYNTLKPSMYIYYRRFVDRMPGWPVLIRVSLAFSALGIVSAVTFLAALRYVPAMHKFETGKWATVILFLAYGTGILNAVYTQAFALNKESAAGDAWKATVRATLASFVVLAAALCSPPPLALILLALQYPTRDTLQVTLMDRLRRKRTITTG